MPQNRSRQIPWRKGATIEEKVTRRGKIGYHANFLEKKNGPEEKGGSCTTRFLSNKKITPPIIGKTKKKEKTCSIC